MSVAHAVEEIRALEMEVSDGARVRAAAKGEALESERTFFQAPNHYARQRHERWPIDKVVAWSRTSRGGRQVELFAPPREGCMRWGLCDAAPQELSRCEPTASDPAKDDETT